MTTKLWDYFEGEPYLANPRLLVVNRKHKPARKKRKPKPMATRRRRRTTPARTSRRRTTYRRNAYVANPPRRRATRRPAPVMARRRRSYRKNPPAVLGFRISEIMYAGAAVIVQPIAERQILALLPAAMSGTMAGRWSAKVGSSVAIGWGARTIFGKRIGELAMLVLGANLVADAVDEILPAIPGLTGLGAYVPRSRGMGSYVTAGARLPLGVAPPGAYTGVSPRDLKPMTASEDPFRASI
jgi:hypothetical protein